MRRPSTKLVSRRGSAVAVLGMLGLLVPLGAAAADDTAGATAADDGQRSSGTFELRMLGDLNHGLSPSNPDAATSSHGSVVFSGWSDGRGREPWVSDGTPPGTRLIADLTPGKTGTVLRHVASNAAGTVLLTDDRKTNLDALVGSMWFTTATKAPDGIGTTSLLARGLDWVSADATRIGADALVSTSDFGDVARLWRTDGTAAGTQLVSDDHGLGIDLTPVGRRVFFTDAENPLMVTDGTGAGTRVVRGWADGPFGAATVHGLTDVDGQAFFTVTSRAKTGSEVWVSDGTQDGTRVVEDIRAGVGSSFPHQLTAVPGLGLFFAADDGVHGLEVWRTDGTAAGTVRVTDLAADRVKNLTACRGKLYFTTPGSRAGSLWVTDSATGPVHRVARLGSPAGGPKKLTCVKGGLAFKAHDGGFGLELVDLADWGCHGGDPRSVRPGCLRTQAANPGRSDVVLLRR